MENVINETMVETKLVEMAKAYAVSTYICGNLEANDYDIFLSLKDAIPTDEEGDYIYEIWSPFETETLAELQKLVKQECQIVLALLKKVEQLSKKDEVTNLGTVEKLDANGDVRIEYFKELLAQADAISIDDSPMLTNWNLSNDDEVLIDTKWNEDDQEWECNLADFEIEKIIFSKDGSFHIYHKKDTPMVRVKLFKIQAIGI